MASKNKKTGALKIVINCDVKNALSGLSLVEKKLDSIEKRIKNIQSGFITISGKQLTASVTRQRSVERLS